jgi:hypothetical protein
MSATCVRNGSAPSAMLLAASARRRSICIARRHASRSARNADLFPSSALCQTCAAAGELGVPRARLVVSDLACILKSLRTVAEPCCVASAHSPVCSPLPLEARHVLLADAAPLLNEEAAVLLPHVAVCMRMHHLNEASLRRLRLAEPDTLDSLRYLSRARTRYERQQRSTRAASWPPCLPGRSPSSPASADKAVPMRALRMDSLAESLSLFPAEEGAAAAAMYQGESRFLPLVDAAAATWRVIHMSRPASFRNLVAAPASALLAPLR